MSRSDEKVENEILSVLESCRKPSKPTTVFAAVKRQDKDLPASEIRNAVWRLISTEKIELTPELKLVSKRSLKQQVKGASY